MLVTTSEPMIVIARMFDAKILHSAIEHPLFIGSQYLYAFMGGTQSDRDTFGKTATSCALFLLSWEPSLSFIYSVLSCFQSSDPPSPAVESQLAYESGVVSEMTVVLSSEFSSGRSTFFR